MTPGVPPVAPTPTGTGFTAPSGGDQDWNMGTTSTTTHDWAEDTTGDWGTTEPKVGEVTVLGCFLVTEYLFPFSFQATAGNW